ncbi:hypothetical protein [uncultured Selenomonas sp.]|nr:hypothetical protein [uncultured Selenomonas sp.]
MMEYAKTDVEMVQQENRMACEKDSIKDWASWAEGEETWGGGYDE